MNSVCVIRNIRYSSIKVKWAEIFWRVYCDSFHLFNTSITFKAMFPKYASNTFDNILLVY